jgi:tetratricopeptide (TPR) repeat protein
VSERFVIRRLGDIEGYAEPGRPQWHMLRSVLGIESFGINAWRATAAGQTVIGEHDELGQGAGGHEELYLVLSGQATFTVDGVDAAAPAGSLVLVRDPAVRRSAVADEEGTVILVVGGKPGEPFRVSPWERSAEALRYWTTGEWERAIAVLQHQLAEDPANANVLYNLACAESRAGRTDDALRHLNAAVGLEARFAELAATDGDLDPIREDARFPSTGVDLTDRSGER